MGDYLKINTTRLDSYANYVCLDEDADVERFISEIKEKKSTPEMDFGVAFHGILQGGGVRLDNGDYSYNEERFIAPVVIESDVVVSAKESFDIFLRGVSEAYPSVSPLWELRGEKEYFTEEGLRVVLVGKADGILGDLIEIKTTNGSFSYDRYNNSLQWRVYMDIFGIDRVWYIVYEIGSSKRTGKRKIKDNHCFSFIKPYNNNNYIKNILLDFIKFIQYHKLEEYFTP